MRHFCVLVFFGCATVFAAIPRLYEETALVFQKSSGVASINDPWALLRNPAGLSFLENMEWTAGYAYEWSNPTAHHLQSAIGVGVFPGFSIGLAGNSHFGVGVGTTLGLAIGDGHTFALGLSGHKQRRFVLAEADPWLLDLGVQVHPTQWLGVGVAFHQLHSAFGSPYATEIGFAFRPFGSLLTFGVDAHLIPSEAVHGTASAQLGLPWVCLSTFVQLNNLDLAPKPFFGLGIDIPFEHLSVGGVAASTSKTHFYGGARMHYARSKQKGIASKRQWAWIRIEEGGLSKPISLSLTQVLFNPMPHPLIFLQQVASLAYQTNIDGVVLHIKQAKLGVDEALNWREAILAIQQANKKVVVYLESSHPWDYLLASGADRVYIHPALTLNINPFRSTLLHLKDLLGKIGIKAQSVTAGSYKTSPQFFTESKPSGEEIETATNIIQNYYREFGSQIAFGRELSVSDVYSAIALNRITSKEALEWFMADQVIAVDDVKNQIESDFSVPISLTDQSLDSLESGKYWGVPKQVAIIPIEGTIIDGRATPTVFPSSSVQVGSDDIVDALEETMRDPNVVVVMLYINSPGGSAEASYLVHEKIKRFKAIKPIIVVMNQVAASGGYEIASAATQIFAHPTVLTGSIGVFSLFFSAEELAQKIGVHTHEITASQNPGPSLFRPMNPEEQKRLQTVVDWHYDLFRNSVKISRNLTDSQIQAVSNGRVWTGKEALERQLLDRMGGFLSALASIKEMLHMAKDQELSIRVLERGGLPFQLTHFAGFQKDFLRMHLEMFKGPLALCPFLPILQ